MGNFRKLYAASKMGSNCCMIPMLPAYSTIECSCGIPRLDFIGVEYDCSFISGLAQLGITAIFSSLKDLLVTSVVFMVDDGTIIFVADLKMNVLAKFHALTHIAGIFIHFVAIKISGWMSYRTYINGILRFLASSPPTNPTKGGFDNVIITSGFARRETLFANTEDRKRNLQ